MSLADDPEWADVTPLNLAASVAALPVVNVAYTAEWVERQTYFAAVVARGDMSSRALRLTTALIEQNGADYSAWHWRWRCVQAAAAGGEAASAAALLQELRFTEEQAEENAKNYQLWNHRRLVAGALCAAEGRAAGARERAFTAAVLQVDAKNYHAWAHRGWAAAAFDAFEEELEFSARMLEADARNNSAWNARHAALTRAAAEPRQPSPAELLRELELAEWHVGADGGNEAAWAYARSLAGLAGDEGARRLQRVAAAAAAAEPGNAFALCALAEGAEARARAAEAAGEAAAAEEAAGEARGLFARCAAADPIRAPYYAFRARAGALWAAEQEAGESAGRG